MKPTKVLLLLTTFLFGFAVQSFCQEPMPNVNIKAVRYKYLNAVDQKELAQPVKMLEKVAAEYDVTKDNYYEEEYQDKNVLFFIPDGEILAAYDKTGRLLSTVEKFKNIAVPQVVRSGVTDRYPGWLISRNVYLVNYFDDKGATMVYKFLLENGNKKVLVKVNEKGAILK